MDRITQRMGEELTVALTKGMAELEKAGLFASILQTRLQNIPPGKDSGLPRLVARATAICTAARTAAEGFIAEAEAVDLSDPCARGTRV